jgi:Predicted integral membrane protein
MHKGRLEAFSDGVLAIIITIMVLELKAPHGESFADLLALAPIFLSYILSFMYVGIYWNNHHHLFQAVKHVKGPILWANLHLLFWLSLIPFATAWMDENHFHSLPVAAYGFVLIMCAIAYSILVRTLLREHGKDSDLAKAIGKDTKGNLSTLIYLAGIPLAFVSPYISLALYITVALVWLIPDIRVERILKSDN